MCLVTLSILVYTFAGFGVFWLRTGSTRIGDGGTFTGLGDLVWMGPIFAWGVVFLLVGPRGPFRALWSTPTRITLDRAGVSWRLRNGDAGSCPWEEFGGASSGVDHRAKWRAIFHRDGHELIGFEAPLVDEATGRKVRLPLLIVRARPDLFEPLDPNHPERACVRRAAPVLAEVRDRLVLDAAR
jgi:hypothetical protein